MLCSDTKYEKASVGLHPLKNKKYENVGNLKFKNLFFIQAQITFRIIACPLESNELKRDSVYVCEGYSYSQIIYTAEH